jgi:hypothetical protein
LAKSPEAAGIPLWGPHLPRHQAPTSVASVEGVWVPAGVSPGFFFVVFFFGLTEPVVKHPWQHAVARRPPHSCGRTRTSLSTAVPWCVARCRAVTALRRSRTPCCLVPPKRFITRMGCHRPRQPGCQPLYMGRTAAGNNRPVDEPALRPSGRAQWYSGSSLCS